MKTTIIAAFLACLFSVTAEAKHRIAPTPGASGCDMSSGRCALDPIPGIRGQFKGSNAASRARHPAQDRVSEGRIGQGSAPASKSHPAASYAVARNVIAILTERFVSPAAVCGANILRAFHAKVAAIIEPVRPGYVQIKTASGRTAVVAQTAAARFVAFIRDLEAIGYPIRDIGGYAYRRIAGTRHLSKHAFGLAIDINQVQRDVVSVRMDRRLVSRLASRNGLVSGGDWRHGDLGHFEAMGTPHRRARKVRLARAS